MRNIQFNQELTTEQYQMAVRVLEAIGLDVQKNEALSLPLQVIEGIEQGWQELREGRGIPSAEVHKKARLLCANK
ncbi:hypothetical protein [Capnocytophaga sp. HP1101]